MAQTYSFIFKHAMFLPQVQLAKLVFRLHVHAFSLLMTTAHGGQPSADQHNTARDGRVLHVKAGYRSLYLRCFTGPEV